MIPALPSPAHAQDQGGQAGAYRGVGTTCLSDYKRLCPREAQLDTGGEAQLFCLKFLKSDVSLRCRRAINAAQHQG